MECIVCKSKNLQNLKDNYKYFSEIFKKLFPNLIVRKCNSCGLIQVNIEDTEENNKKLFKYYQSNYRENGVVPSLENSNQMFYKRGEFISGMISKYISDKNSVLNVFEKGCGFGFNLMHIKKIFPNANLYTDEMDEHAKPLLEKIGIQSKSWITGGGGYCDVIIMSHVLEHFTNPLAEINIAYENLKSEGLFYIEVPNSLNLVEPHISFWTDQTFLKMYGDFLADRFSVEEFNTWGAIYRFDDGKNGEFQKSIVDNVMKGKISRNDALSLKIPNGVYLRMLLRKRK